ncbi:MAG: radical SAM protein, partial [Ekhidna sp.]|nr:radical SAM protein [Ekhidna sp.]
MYSKIDYVKRGLRLANNLAFPGNKKISTLMIYGTDLCDSGCKHCLIWAKRPVKYLTYEKITEIMNSKCISKSTVVGLEGGEFLLHPDAEKILEWFSKNHPHFDLLSNCLKPEKVIESVKKYTPRRLFVSLDGTRETYKYMRGKDGYDGVLSVIQACKSSVPISAMFTLSPYNSFEDLDHVIEVCQENDIDVRVGVYNDIEFFDTVEKAHETEISTLKNTEQLTFGKDKKELKDIALTKK